MNWFQLWAAQKQNQRRWPVVMAPWHLKMTLLQWGTVVACWDQAAPPLCPMDVGAGRAVMAMRNCWKTVFHVLPAEAWAGCPQVGEAGDMGGWEVVEISCMWHVGIDWLNVAVEAWLFFAVGNWLIMAIIDSLINWLYACGSCESGGCMWQFGSDWLCVAADLLKGQANWQLIVYSSWWLFACI